MSGLLSKYAIGCSYSQTQVALLESTNKIACLVTIFTIFTAFEFMFHFMNLDNKFIIF